MNKGLKELKRLPKAIKDTFKDSFDIIKKELKALKVIKNYIHVNKPFGNACYIYLNDESEMISEKEYESLKEVLS